MAVKYNPWPGYYLFMARIGRSLNGSYVTTTLPAIYTDKPLETMQRFISSSVFSLSLSSLSNTAAFFIVLHVVYIHALKNISTLGMVLSTHCMENQGLF